MEVLHLTGSVGTPAYHAGMPTHLTLDRHLAALATSGAVLRDAAARAGLDAPVPTCPTWHVAELVSHQGMVHRWAAANLRGDADHDTDASLAEAGRSTDLLGWYDAGLAALLEALRGAPDDVRAQVFLRDAPPPRRFWARRQAHETTVHSADAVAAALGRWPGTADLAVPAELAADGVDELLTGFITRGGGKLHAAQPYTVLVRTDDTGHAWTVRISDGPIVTTPGGDGGDAVFSGTAAALYLSLWNRADEITCGGRAGALAQWRSAIRIRWS